MLSKTLSYFLAGSYLFGRKCARALAMAPFLKKLGGWGAFANRGSAKINFL